MRRAFRKPIVLVAAMSLVWVMASWTSFADLRIVHQADGSQMETLFKGNRIAQPVADGGTSLLFCETGELALVSPPKTARYWQGSLKVFEEMTDAMLGQGSEAQSGIAELGGLLGAIFGGSSEPEKIEVRVSKVGEQTISGYATEHYVIETGSGNNWRVYEEQWISKDLLREISTEIDACIDLMLDMASGVASLGGLFGMDELEAVLASADYQALQREGYPVRTKTTVRGLFGQTTQTTSEIVAVSAEPIAEDAFAVPTGYRRVDSLMEVYGM